MYAHEDDRIIVPKHIKQMSRKQLQKEISKSDKKWEKRKKKFQGICKYNSVEEKLAAAGLNIQF